MPGEVDRIADVYQAYRTDGKAETHWSGENLGNRLMEDERHTELANLLERAGFLPIEDMRVLDVGCGDGHVLARLLDLGADPSNLVGVDLLPHRVEEARRRYPEITFRQANAEQLPFGDAEFDLVFAYTVFSSILSPEMSRNVAGEIRRVLRPTGAVVWYDLRTGNPFNSNVHGLRKRDVRKLFPECSWKSRAVTVLPPLARRLTPRTAVLYNIFRRLKIMNTHYLALLRPWPSHPENQLR